MADINQPTPAPLGFGGVNPADNAPVPAPAWDASEARRKREQEASFGDYVGSIWRQDGLADGVVASIAGAEMMPDVNYNPFTDKSTKDLEAGVWDQYKPELYQAHSAAHAMFIQGRLLDKQKDLIRLEDMGMAGTVGRFALNAIMPDQLLMSLVGGRVAQGVGAIRGARVGATVLASAEAAAASEAAGLAARASKSAIAAGVGAGAAENAAYEAVRQSVNFESDNGQILEAGLMGAAFTAPFAIVGARTAARAAQAAHQEHMVLRALRDVEEGKTLTPDQGKLIDDVHKAHTALRDFEAGRIDEATLERTMDDFHGPVEPPAVWMERYGAEIRAKGQSIIDEHFPASTGDAAVPKAKGKPSEMPESHADAAAAKARGEGAPVKTAMALAFEGANARRVRKAQDNEALRKAFDLDQLDNVKRAERAAGHKVAEAAREKARAADFEKALNARENARALSSEDPFAAPKAAAEPQVGAKAPDGPANAPVSATKSSAASMVDEAVAARDLIRSMESRGVPESGPQRAAYDEALRHRDEIQAERIAENKKNSDAQSHVGQPVSWMGKDGETLSGTVTSFNADLGKLIVKTDDGMKAVNPEQLDLTDFDHAPSGFLHGSVGSAQILPVQSIAAQRSWLTEATRMVGSKHVKVPLRFDIYAALNASPSERIRKLAYKLVKDPIQNDSFEAQGMTASEWKKQIQRTVGGEFHRVSVEAAGEGRKAAGVPIWKAASFNHEFHSLVSRVTRGDPSVALDHPHLMPALTKASAAQSKFYAGLIEHAKAAGVKGAEAIQANDLYVNRVWHHGNMRKVSELHGDDAVTGLVASSIQRKQEIIDRMRKSPGRANWTDDQILTAKAKSFLSTIRSLEFNPALREIALKGRDMGTLRRELADLNVPDSQIDDLVDLMFEVRPGADDAGRAANLKFRFALDESATVKTKAGTLRLSDLFENDSRVLADVYSQSIAGRTGLAKHGIDSDAAWAAQVKLAADDAAAQGLGGASLAGDFKLLEDMYSHIVGRPMSTADFSKTARAASAFRGYTRAVMLPQLGIAAAFEMNKAIALMGFKSLVQQVPSFRSLLTAVRKGYIPDEGLARDIMAISGFGQEKAAAYFRGQEIEDGFFGQGLTRLEAGANRASHAVDVMSGNSSFTSLTKQLAGMMATQQMHSYASGTKKLTAKMRERWVGQGLSDDMIDDVMDALKAHTTADSGVVKEIDYEAWQKASPRTYEKFQTFLSRQVRDAIQDQDIGETMPFMHSTLGKMFAELKTFFLVGHAKNFLKNAAYHDATAAQVWALGFIGESLAYMTQTAVNYPTELEERLTPPRIATAAYFRMSAAGTASMLTETGYSILTGGDSLIQPGTTTNTDNRSFLSTPSMTVGKRLFNLPSTLAGAALGTDVTTRKEGKDAWGTIPGANLYGLKAAGNWWTNTLPKSDPTKSNR